MGARGKLRVAPDGMRAFQAERPVLDSCDVIRCARSSGATGSPGDSMTIQRLVLVSSFGFCALFSASSAHAIDKCKVKVDAKSGVISVSASGVAGTLQWGSSAGAEDNAFFNPSCVADGTAKGCQLADPMTAASKTPPEGCTIYLDDGSAPCSMWIKGCSPGLRSAPTAGALVWKDASGAVVGAADDTGVQLYRETNGVIVRMAVQSGNHVFNETGEFHYNSSDCTGTALVVGANSTIRNPIVNDAFSGIVYYAPDGGTYQNDNSILRQDPMIMAPPDCSAFYPGSTFVAIGRCCQSLPNMQYLTVPAIVDFTGVAWPIAPALN